MTRNLSIITAAIVAVLALSACRSNKEAVQGDVIYNDVPAASSSDLTARYDRTVDAYRPWQTFVANGHIDINAGHQLGSNVQVKMVRGKSIFISLRPMLGIEIGKLLVTNDSIFITDKVNKVFVADDISKFTLGLPLGISMLQDIVLNRPFSLRGGTLTSSDHRSVTLAKADTGAGWTATPSDQLPGITYSFNFNDRNRLTRLAVKPKVGKAVNVDYSDFFDLPQGTLAGNVSFDASIMGTAVAFAIDYDHGSVRWDTPVNNDKATRSTYRRVSLVEYLRIIRKM